MLPTVRQLIPMFVAAGLLLGGNGLQSTLLSLRGTQEGFSTLVIGLLGTGYFTGYVIGCFVHPWLVRRVGHIRVFAALAALIAAGTLGYTLMIEPWAWIAIRTFIGFCFAGMFALMESWLNAISANQNRARVFSVYRIIDLSSVAAGQYIIPWWGLSGSAVFSFMVILTCLSVIPVSLGDRSDPQPPHAFKVDPRTIWTISPIAAAGCVAIGLNNSAFWLINPLQLESIGFSLTQIATFIACAIAGAVLLQFPLGYFSDRVDRRLALAVAAGCGALAAVGLAFLDHPAPAVAFAFAFVYGAAALPLYALVSAHAYDRAQPGQYMILASGLSFFFSCGAVVGPLVASTLFHRFGGTGIYGYLATVLGTLALLAAFRLVIRPGTEPEDVETLTGVRDSGEVVSR